MNAFVLSLKYLVVEWTAHIFNFSVSGERFHFGRNFHSKHVSFFLALGMEIFYLKWALYSRKWTYIGVFIKANILSPRRLHGAHVLRVKNRFASPIPSTLLISRKFVAYCS